MCYECNNTRECQSCHGIGRGITSKCVICGGTGGCPFCNPQGNASAPDSNARQYWRILPYVLALILYPLARYFESRPADWQRWRTFRGELAIVLTVGGLLVAAVSSWIVGAQMRRKIKKDLGRNATDADLTSIDTWMKVTKVEDETGGNKPL
jgi:hypothetical protein